MKDRIDGVKTILHEQVENKVPVTPFSPSKIEMEMGHLENPWARMHSFKTADLRENMRDPNPLFLGRDDILDKIHESYIKDRKATKLTRRKTVVHIINGLAGCGKSEIAIQYVNKYSSEYMSGVLWIQAGSTSTLDYVLKQISEKLKLSEEKTDFRANYIQKAITDWLQEQTDWLLVLDNADDAGCIYDYFPRFPDGGHIIITSRDRKFKSLLYPAIKAPFDVRPLRQEDAELLLVTSFFVKAGEDPDHREVASQKLQKMKDGDPQEYEALRWLAGPDGLDGLPLALNTAITYMKENDRSFKEYKEYSCLPNLAPELFPDSEDDPLNAWLRKSGLSVVKYHKKLEEKTQMSLTSFLELTEEDLRNDIGMEDSEVQTFMEERKHDVNINKWMYRRKRVLATWSLSFRKIIGLAHGPAAMELLQLCAYITPTLSESIIIKGAEFITLKKLQDRLLENVEGHPRSSKKAVQIQKNLDEILQCLRRYSLIENLPTRSREKCHLRRSFTIHRVVRKAIKIKLNEQEIIKTISCAVNVLTNLIPSFEVIHRNFTRRYQPLPEMQEEVAMHVKILSRNLRREWLTSTECKMADPVPLLNAAALYFELFKSRPEEAQKLYAKAFECTAILTTAEDSKIRSRKLGDAECQLGLILLKLDERKEAFSHLQAAGDNYSKCCPDEDSDSDIDMAKYHYLMARAYEDEYWKLDKAPPDHVKTEILDKIESAISISKKYHTNREEHYGEWTALSMHELALFRLQMGPRDMHTIEQLLKESLEIKQRIWGDEDDGDHVSTAIGMTDLARFYILNEDQTKYKEVEGLLLNALKMKERVLPQYQQSDSWQLGVYYLVRLYMLLNRDDDEKLYREKLKKINTERPFKELFEVSDPYKAYPPDVILWSRSIR
ncbi:uncharacterized protein LOC144437299 [Glandiceps talaboti]